MMFESRLTTRQFTSIFQIIVGVVSVYISVIEKTSAAGLLLIIGLIMMITAVKNFIEDSIKKYKIKNSFKSNNYDSHGEQKIADYFKRKNIIFIHHPTLKVPKLYFGLFNIPFQNITIEPDFFLPEYNLFVEYWGMIDNPEYKEKSYDVKKKLYEQNDINLISLYPKNLDNLDWNFTQKLLDIIKKREGINRKWR